ncbi:aldo/keto reductase [Kitasatospora sp. NPDC001540]|uniref:aldo/keto reductase n=1 Tax=Kitasatospora sp. NPDC001540 TaxID=3364014 RepID=UPI0036C24C7A
MQQRTLGTQGLTVSAIGYGAMGLTMAYGPGDEQAGVAAVRRAYELGVTFFDTAELYNWGARSNEELLGRAVNSFRDQIVLATKFGFARTERGLGFDSRPENIRKVAENSLRALGTDRLDVLYQHRVDPAVPIEEVAGAVKELIDAGKVRYFGLSEAGPETIRRAHAVQPVSVLQTEYSLFERDVERVFPTLDELGIGFVAYSPLGRGFLTSSSRPAGQYDPSDMRNHDPRWQPGAYERNLAAVARLGELAAEQGTTVPQLALAWLLARGPHVVPIPGTRSAARMAENARAAWITLDAEDLAAVDAILPHGGFGARYQADSLPVWS